MQPNEERDQLISAELDDILTPAQEVTVQTHLDNAEWEQRRQELTTVRNELKAMGMDDLRNATDGSSSAVSAALASWEEAREKAVVVPMAMPRRNQFMGRAAAVIVVLLGLTAGGAVMFTALNNKSSTSGSEIAANSVNGENSANSDFAGADKSSGAPSAVAGAGTTTIDLSRSGATKTQDATGNSNTLDFSGVLTGPFASVAAATQTISSLLPQVPSISPTAFGNICAASASTAAHADQVGNALPLAPTTVAEANAELWWWNTGTAQQPVPVVGIFETAACSTLAIVR